MTGLLDGYGIDMEDIEAPSYDVADDIYEFEVTDFYLQEGTDNFPERTWLVIQYGLGEKGKSKSEWFELPEDASNPTDNELLKLGFYKNRLRDLGIEDSQMNSVGPDDLIGITGTLQVFTRKGFQNIKNVKIDRDDDGTNEFKKKETAPRGRRTTAAAKAPAKTSKPAPKDEPDDEPEPEEDEQQEETEEKAPARGARRSASAGTTRARAAGVKPNPFRN